MLKYALTSLLLLILSCPAFGQELRVVTNSLPPVKFEQDGKVVGVASDLLVEAFAKAGHKLKPADIILTSWARAYEEALSRPGTLLLSMAKTADRQSRFKWVGPVHTTTLGLIGRADRQYDIEKAADAARYRVCVMKRTAPEQLLLKQGFPGNKSDCVSKAETALRLLKEDRVDLFAYSADTAFFMMPILGMNPGDYKVHYEIKVVELYFGLNRSFSDAFVKQLQSGLDELKRPNSSGVSRYDEIVGKYIKR